MPGPAADLARRLARDAEAVCRYYLSNGCRRGRYWTAGDVSNTPGRSLYVRLTGPDSGPGAAGKWTDSATGQYGDLLDLIGLARGIEDVRDAMKEARWFLALIPPEPRPKRPSANTLQRTPAKASDAARRLFRAGRPIRGTQAERYLRARGITAPLDTPALRFHPDVWYREDEHAPRQSWPALLAAVGDQRGGVSGLQRTWLDRTYPVKAPVPTPRKALGQLLGNAVWIGLDASKPAEVVAAGEGLETMLALRSLLLAMPMAAALSAPNLAALVLDPPPGRLYIARDNDAAGIKAAKRLRARAKTMSIGDVRDLEPALKDWNADLRTFGHAWVLARLAGQLAPDDLSEFIHPERTGT